MRSRNEGLIIVILALFVVTVPNVSAQEHGEHNGSFHASKIVAGFHIELTVEPSPIEPDMPTKFSMVFRDSETGEDVTIVQHTFMLKRDSTTIFEETTSSASYIHEFLFTEEQEGPLTVVIANVNDSGESAEFNLMVVPEFPYALLTISVMMSVMLAFKSRTLPRP
jgi:hypothetical protein